MWGGCGPSLCISVLLRVREESSALVMGQGYGTHTRLSSSCSANSMGEYVKHGPLILIEVGPNIPKTFPSKVSRDPFNY